jgi:putative peptidoglycan lipid II flippase
LEPLQTDRIHRSILMVGCLAASGYLLSILRDALLATYYGGSFALDVYFIALSPAQYIGMEGASLVYLAFLPEFTRSRRASNPSGHAHVLRARLTSTAKAALGAAILLAAICATFPQWLAPGYLGHGAMGALRMSVAVLCALIPGLAVVGVLRAALEAQARFSAWALLPGLRSITLIVCILLSASHPALGWLLAGSLLGVALAMGYAGLALREHGKVVPSSAPPAGQSARSLPSSLVPLSVAVLLGALTTIVDNAFASRAGVGGAQTFALATNLLVAPQSIIGGVVATVFFPVYGRLWVGDRRPEAFTSLSRSMRLVALGLVPVVALLVVAGLPIVRIVYRHGVFTESLAVLVSHTVAGLALGQVFYAGSVLLRQFLLVMGAPWAVCEAAIVFLAAKWVGNVAFMKLFGLPGVALASSLAALVTCAFLVVRVLRLAKLPHRATE